jgi:hypothetical protein
MRISGKAEQADVDDARQLILGRLYWARFLLNPFVYGVLGGVTLVMLWSWWHRYLMIGAVASVVPVIVLLGLHFHDAHRFRDKHLRQMNATLPDWIIVLPNGVQLEAQDGTILFTPWVRYRTYREGKRVIWLKPIGGQTDVMLPISSLSTTDKQALRDRLEAAFALTGR